MGTTNINCVNIIFCCILELLSFCFFLLHTFQDQSETSSIREEYDNSFTSQFLFSSLSFPGCFCLNFNTPFTNSAPKPISFKNPCVSATFSAFNPFTMFWFSGLSSNKFLTANNAHSRITSHNDK